MEMFLDHDHDGENVDKESLADKFKRMQLAYRNLFLGSLELLELDSLFWTEKLLLRLVNSLSRKRLHALHTVLIDIEDNEDNVLLRQNMMEAQVVAALGGHQLGSWETAEAADGYQAVCTICGGSVFVSEKTIYSILTDTCTGQAKDTPDTH